MKNSKKETENPEDIFIQLEADRKSGVLKKRILQQQEISRLEYQNQIDRVKQLSKGFDNNKEFAQSEALRFWRTLHISDELLENRDFIDLFLLGITYFKTNASFANWILEKNTDLNAREPWSVLQHKNGETSVSALLQKMTSNDYE